MSRFAIVKFPKENNAVAVVPKSWLKDDCCYWPPRGADSGKMAKKDTAPDTDKWSKCEAIVIQYFDDYKDARKNLNPATISSDLDSNDSVRKEKPTHELPLPDLDEDVNGQDDMGGNSLIANDDHQGGSSSFVYIIDVQKEEKSTQTAEFQDTEKLFSRIDAIDLKLKEIIQMLVPILASKQVPISAEACPEINSLNFPLKSEEELTNFSELLLSISQAAPTMIEKLKSAGGSEVATVVESILKKLMTDELQAKYSLYGAKGKNSLVKVKGLRQLIKDAVAAHPRTPNYPDEGTVDEEIQKSLKKVADRVGKRMRK
ncbi:uncharacterized protein LOC110843420 [Folsomia candida]|uniref:uncharacterized protein LOC110843420 n=1 Tax=Folsomia candida TaxID=158441 RepID=UPI0016055B37|nr:uncharacterized protein LOC110843420 [Folsomia candida]